MTKAINVIQPNPVNPATKEPGKSGYINKVAGLKGFCYKEIKFLFSYGKTKFGPTYIKWL